MHHIFFMLGGPYKSIYIPHTILRLWSQVYSGERSSCQKDVSQQIPIRLYFPSSNGVCADVKEWQHEAAHEEVDVHSMGTHYCNGSLAYFLER